MAVDLFQKSWKGGAVLVSLSDYWKRNGKPVKFEFRRIPGGPSRVKAWTVVLGPLLVGIGFTSKHQ